MTATTENKESRHQVLGHAAVKSDRVLLLATDQQVFAFDLNPSTKVTIGRHESNELKLVSRTVSNFHAEILVSGGKLLVRDLGSTNGTRVNGKRIDERPLKKGDRIRVGNHVLSVQVKNVDEPDESDEDLSTFDAFGPGRKGRIISVRTRAVDTTLQAEDPNDLLLHDLLKLVGSFRGTAVVYMERDQSHARLFARDKRIVHAEYGTAIGEKALYRLFSWQSGTYEVRDYPDDETIPTTIDLPTETLILEGMQHNVELGKTIAALPPLEAPLTLKEDCSVPVSDHTPAEMEIYKLLIRHETIAKVLESSRLTDVRTLKLISSLLAKGAFEVEAHTDMTLGTFNLKKEDLGLF
jgi:pSer/pThr/pTyr-binding forkhead associated (FHA) protein